jgi:hypothetical protein
MHIHKDYKSKKQNLKIDENNLNIKHVPLQEVLLELSVLWKKKKSF